MRVPVPRSARNALMGGGVGSDSGTDPRQSFVNTWLNQRLDNRFNNQSPEMDEWHRMISERVPHMLTPPGYDNQFRSSGGSDLDMMQMYGPEDQVAYDGQGRPIPLADPRHPRNQRMPTMPAYPQQRR